MAVTRARFEHLSESERNLADIAAVLGADVPRFWLSECCDQMGWSKTDFRLALDGLLREGILQYSGTLTDIDDRNVRYRELKWIDLQVRQSLSCSLSREFGGSVVDACLKVIDGKVLDRHMTAEQFEGAVHRIRCKIRVFELLQRYEDRCQGHALLMALGWALLGERAQSAGAPGECLRRLGLATDWSAKISKEQDARLAERLRLRIETFRLRAALDMPRRLQGFASSSNRREADPSDDEFRVLHFNRDRAEWAHRIRSTTCESAHLSAQAMARSAYNLTQAKDDFLFETNHVLCVTLFSMGRLIECHTAASEGKTYCLAHPLLAAGLSMSGHDGRVCCKMFVALSDLLSPQQVTAVNGPLDVVLKFMGEVKDSLTKRIGYSYAALYQILKGDDNAFASAAEYCKKCHRLSGGGAFVHFTALVEDCAMIGHLSQDDSPSRDNAASLASKLEADRAKWDSNQYDTLWLTYLGVARALANDVQAAEETFASALRLAAERGELVFRPETCRWQAWQKLRTNKLLEAITALEIGQEYANEMSATLFFERLAAQAAELKNGAMCLNTVPPHDRL